MDHLLKYSTLSEIDTTEIHPCPGTVLVGTEPSDYKMVWCDYGENTGYRITIVDDEMVPRMVEPANLFMVGISALGQGRLGPIETFVLGTSRLGSGILGPVNEI